MASRKSASTGASGSKSAAGTKRAAKTPTQQAAGKAAAPRARATKATGQAAPRAGGKTAGRSTTSRAGTVRPSARASKKEIVAPTPARQAEKPGTPGASFDAAKVAAEAAVDKKAEEVVILDVRGLTSYADYFVVASGTSDRQVNAIADAVEEKMKKAGHRPIGTEGYRRGHWVLMDFGDVVAHIFYDEARAFYDIEGLWGDAPRIPVE